MNLAQVIQIIFTGGVAFATFGLAFVTFILVLITFFYMLATKRMANVMQKEFDLRMEPHIEEQISRDRDALKPMVRINVTNIGFYNVYFDHVFYRMWKRDKPQEIFKQDVRFVNKNIQPNKSHQVNVRLDFSELAGFSDYHDVHKDGLAQIELHFRDIRGKKFKRFENKILTWFDKK